MIFIINMIFTLQLFVHVCIPINILFICRSGIFRIFQYFNKHRIHIYLHISTTQIVILFSAFPGRITLYYTHNYCYNLLFFILARQNSQ